MSGAVTAPPMPAVGVAGWAYPDWRDTVYRLPAPQVQPTLFAMGAPGTERTTDRHAPDPLAFLVQYVDMIEVNSSFYRVPTAASTAAWARKGSAKPGFFFTAKLHQDFTHGFQRSATAAADFRAAFAPLREAGLLRGFLAQFRYDVGDTPRTRAMLTWLRDQFEAFVHLVVEVRHVSWQQDEAASFLHELGVSVAVLDYPVASDSFRTHRNIGAPDGYFRLHGRNYATWFGNSRAPHEPYDYDYPEPEIDQLADTALSLFPQVRSLTIVANNHYQGKGLSAALRLKSRLLGQRLPVPPALLETYPNLQRIALAGGTLRAEEAT